MKEKTKEFMKKYLIGFILGVLTVGIIKVSAETFFPSNQVTYDNTESGLTSNDVQGAIDELYNTCFPPKASDTIIENAGLEKDPYECRYFFKGASPNNYITFNGEDAGWRIISVECDGAIKIMRRSSLGEIQWDTSGLRGSNNWARPATLNTYLNWTYYNELNSTAQSQIFLHDWSIGMVSYGTSGLDNIVNAENSQKWNGKIALLTVSEYLRTNSNASCNSTLSGGTCLNTTWVYSTVGRTQWWLLTVTSDQVYWVPSGEMGMYYAFSTVTNVFPALYLFSDIKITGGTGTQSNPYQIE